jgi:cyclase
MAFIDVSNANKGNPTEFFKGIEEVVHNSQLPVSLGGKIRSSDDVELYRTFGADRYIINQTEGSSDKLVAELISSYGRSSIISSINHWGPFTASRSSKHHLPLIDRIAEIANNCGGDILLNSVERDGTLRGLDLDTIYQLAEIKNLSLIVSGGLGNMEHLYESLQAPNVVGVCTSNVYHLTTNTISMWRANLIARDLRLRKI